MAFGISPDVMAVTPSHILQAEAERRRQKLAEQELELSRARLAASLAPRHEAGPSRFTLPEEKPESWKSQWAPSGMGEYEPTPGTPEAKAEDFRQMALLEAKAKLTAKPPEEPKEKTFKEREQEIAFKRLSPEKQEQFLFGIKPPKEEAYEEEIPEEFEPTRVSRRGVTYQEPKGEAVSSGQSKLYGNIQQDIKAGYVTTADEITDTIVRAGYDPDSEYFQTLFTQFTEVPAPTARKPFSWSRVKEALKPGRARVPTTPSKDYWSSQYGF